MPPRPAAVTTGDGEAPSSRSAPDAPSSSRYARPALAERERPGEGADVRQPGSISRLQRPPSLLDESDESGLPRTMRRGGFGELVKTALHRQQRPIPVGGGGGADVASGGL